ncbi:hypothetical protein FG386_000367 [Cryptosporidium ryanae]|uniref:uncharacterized protein n=1 Tax=Cryptosporidium ryanae TaxID=515981 RepID=UPI003519FBDE|nr:hypothetical protein FG386_000367 [Cryptosporidium ryanae]
MMEKASIYNEVLEFNFCSCSEKEYGELVHSVIDGIGSSEIDIDRMFEVFKKKLLIQDNGKVGVPVGSREEIQRGVEATKDIVVSDSVYFDSRLSLKKELKKIIQSTAVNSRITGERELSILEYVFSHSNLRYASQNGHEFYVVRHPNPDYNGCRTIAVGERSFFGDVLRDNALSSSLSPKLTPLSYVSCVNKIKSKWETSGKLIVNLMHSVTSMVPRSIKQYIAVFQDIYPVSQRNSVDSYFLYLRILEHGIKLVPASTNILVRFLMDKLLSLESEVNTENPNLYTNERYEKWRQEELHNFALRVRKGEFRDIISAKNYIQDDNLLRKEFSDKFTEEDIDRNVQIIDVLMAEFFEFVNEVCENGLKYKDYFENPICEQSGNKTSKNASQKLLGNPKASRGGMVSGGVLSSSDLESSAIEDSATSPSLIGSECGKKEEQLYKQCVDLASTILEVYETKILSLQKCSFINYIPIYLINNNLNWCENYFQINFRKLFNPLETLMIRKMSVDYIISFILNYKISSNFKFYTPCVRYLMQFLHEFIAHWNMENSSTDGTSSKKKVLISKYNSNSLKNLFELYCHVVNSLCWLFSVISISCISHLDQVRDSGTDKSGMDILFVFDSIFNPNRGFISFVLFGSLSPLESIDSRTPVLFSKSSVLLFSKIVQIQKDKNHPFRDHPCIETIRKARTHQCVASVKLVRSLFEKNQDLASQLDYAPSKLLGKILLRHSEAHINALFSPENNTASLSFIQKVVSSVVDVEINALIDDVSQIRDEMFAQGKANSSSGSELNSNIQSEPETKATSVENITGIVNAYGEMKSSILPQQSLWESVWGTVPVSQEELESDLYITKNKRLRVDCGMDESASHVGTRNNTRKSYGSFSNSDPSGKKPSLLDTILSSEAYKRSKVSMAPRRRRQLTPRRTLS